MGTLLAECAYELRHERRHGASWMARRALETLAEVARASDAEATEDLYEELLEAARTIARSRVEVGAIAGALGRVLAPVRHNLHLDTDQFRRLVEEEARALVAARDRAAASIAIQLRERMTGAVVLTHSASATVREALLYSPPERVICTVSAPNEEGRAFAEELQEAGLPAELVRDEDAGRALAGASLLLLGADTVFRDGSVYNKIGTRALAETAAEAGIPAVVAAEVLKLAPVAVTDGPRLEGEAEQLFDVTPAGLLEAIVTEEGTFRADEIETVANRVPFLAEGYELVHDRG